MAKLNEELIATLKEKLPQNLAEVVDLLDSYYPEARHHEEWTIDQVVRLIFGEHYAEFIEAYEAPRGSKGERFIQEWPEGVAP